MNLKLQSLTLGIALTFAATASSAAWIWDRDENRVDDRIQAVATSGISAAFENGDVTNGRMIFAVANDDGALRFGVYVGYLQQPTAADLERLRSSGVDTRVFHPFVTIPYVQMALTSAEIAKVATLPGIDRIEALEMVYPVNNNATRASGAVDSKFRQFPTVQGNLAITGKGVVISILDTGVNDEFDSVTGYPGHQTYKGKFLGGGNFFSGQPALNTKNNESVNPVDRGVDSVHGSHVAGTTLGTGGPSKAFGGVAPGALLVDEKVLSDAGAGFGSAAGVEWAILNKEKFNIRVLNLSLGGVSNSDGSDAGARSINAAFDAGIISVIATGNDSKTDYIASPSAADKAFSIGALDDKNTIRRTDDTVASFSNEGPRLSDKDADFEDEMKPLVAAPGSGIVSADGLLTTDGRQYKILSGTSMSTPHVAGVVALILEANPALTPTQVRDILRHTSEHSNNRGKTLPTDNPFPQGDPNYHPSSGWGQVDAYAAVKEALRLNGDKASQTQVVSIAAVAAADGSAAIDLTWRTQRETSLGGFDIYRADDVSGAPGTFVKLTATPIAGTGSAVIEQTRNRNEYTFRDASGLTSGRVYWYRIDHTSTDTTIGTIAEPAIAVTLGTAPSVAQIKYSITHNSLDNDLLVLLGSGPQLERAKLIIDGKSSTQADAIIVEPGEATTGNRRHDFTISLTTLDNVSQFLPPSEKNPWFLSVKEGGFINRTGRVNSFSMTLFDASGNPTATYTTKDLTPRPTVDDQTTFLWLPDSPDVTTPGETPGLIEAEPAMGAQGTSNVAVEIFGSEFLPGASVAFSGNGISVNSVDVKSGSRLIVNISIAANATPGPRNVTVRNVDGGSGVGTGIYSIAGGGNNGTVVNLDDADPAIEYRQGWHEKENAGASSGFYHTRAGKGGGNAEPTARLVFTGSQITYHFAKSSAGGTADIYLDGALKETLSYADASKTVTFGHSLTYGNLTNGSHELRIVHRSGAAYIDGFQIVSGAADSSAVQSRSTTETSTATSGGLTAAVVSRAIDVKAGDGAMSILVEGATQPVTVTLLDPLGNVVATGQALLAGSSLSGAEASALSSVGTHTLQIANSSPTASTINISVAKEVRVK